MSKYYIENNGCDDSTKVAIDLTNEEVEVFKKICKELNKQSTYSCQPTIALYKYDECEIEKEDDKEYVYTYDEKNLLKED